MDKPISPWSAEFYLGSKPKTNDEIQHFGNRNSGRYKRGSGKDPDSTGGKGGLGAKILEKQAKQANRHSKEFKAASDKFTKTGERFDKAMAHDTMVRKDPNATPQAKLAARKAFVAVGQDFNRDFAAHQVALRKEKGLRRADRNEAFWLRQSVETMKKNMAGGPATTLKTTILSIAGGLGLGTGAGMGVVKLAQKLGADDATATTAGQVTAFMGGFVGTKITKKAVQAVDLRYHKPEVALLNEMAKTSKVSLSRAYELANTPEMKKIMDKYMY